MFHKKWFIHQSIYASFLLDSLRNYCVIHVRGVIHLRVSAWLENCTIFPQFTLPGTNSGVKCSS